MKRIVEITDTFENQEKVGLETSLFFSEGLIIIDGTFHEIKISSKSINIKDKTTYETMAFGDSKLIYSEKVGEKEEIITAHFKAVDYFKEIYFKQVKT